MTTAEICDLTLVQMTRLLRERRLSAREALEAHLVRIDEVNPVINAVCTLDPEGARAAALAADERAASGAALPLLHGVPMTHKDTHDTAGMRTTLGSPIHAQRVPTQDADIVARLRAAGVITTGKTNVPELAAGSHTFNPLFGTTTNPYDPTRSAGGSSGGVAAAIAAGVQPAGDASDMGGSIRTPASFCNLVGLRPSAGRVPLGSGDPWAWMSRKGPMARTTADLRLLMEVLGSDGHGAALAPHPPVPVPARVAAGDLGGLRVAYSRDLGLGLPVEQPVLDVLDAQVRHLVSLGATVVEASPDLGDADEVFATTRAFDFAVTYGDLYADRPEDLKPALRWNLAKGFDLTSADLRSAVAARARLRRSTSAFFVDHDLLVAPAVQVQPFDASLEHPAEVAGHTMETYLDWMRAATLVSATGLPALSVPAGFDTDGLPVGLQVVAPDGADDLLLAVAEAYERANPQHLRRPALLGAAAPA
ncbi:amidase [Nocardioides lijunqiniae]|uniref:amidase n=1 Tax=Nocardioides lijunqiniae TaxID=2760832 RepID=UPI00187843DA|nr:amidase family protein [Nocardioides lijunqiniae]